VENLRVTVWFEHHSTLEERLRDIAVSLLGLENVGGTVVSIVPMLSASTVSIPKENLGNLLARPGVRMVDLDFEVRADLLLHRWPAEGPEHDGDLLRLPRGGYRFFRYRISSDT
jgi:hypothetical protein